MGPQTVWRRDTMLPEFVGIALMSVMHWVHGQRGQTGPILLNPLWGLAAGLPAFVLAVAQAPDWMPVVTILVGSATTVAVALINKKREGPDWKAKYEAKVEKLSHLEHHLVKLERENRKLRDRIAFATGRRPFGSEEHD